MRKGNHLYEIEVREVDIEKKRIKIHYEGFSEDKDQMSGVTYGSLFDLEGFPFIRVNVELIFRSCFPSVQQLSQWFFSWLARSSLSRLQ